MTDKQYEEYKKLKDDIQPLKTFLFWCGKKYHCATLNHYKMRLIKKKFHIGRVGCGAMQNTEVKIPTELQDRIIEVIEQYVDEKQKELDKI